MCLAVNANDTNNDNPNRVNFTIKDTKLYVPFLTLSAKNNQKLSKFLRKGFERSVYWNEYEGKCENKDTKNEYRYFLQSSFLEVNWLLVLVYLNRDNDIKRYSA